ncbi:MULTISPECIES: cytochrome C oxidase subunit IV family protein [unclassified Chelatococcus]|uniref:cytochrome C oxidase subunit IV family protein n=1 Tax=unclassified Chelatococcus TaxID=2638111 RepID=UPI000371EC22|nr:MULTISPECIES: cytochrome C oxidase subunit IV family protein [unclassified Chelatococcus]ALA20019.1 hypothetical protein AL346_21310 [Chelatococcus sp. CO-6]
MRPSPVRTWLILVVLTLATMAVGLPATAAPWLAGLVVLALALAKGRLIVLDFLELRHAPPLWCGLVTAWLWGVTGLAFLAGLVPLLLAA